jgi:hypothetical protein
MQNSEARCLTTLHVPRHAMKSINMGCKYVQDKFLHLTVPSCRALELLLQSRSYPSWHSSQFISDSAIQRGLYSGGEERSSPKSTAGPSWHPQPPGPHEACLKSYCRYVCTKNPAGRRTFAHRGLPAAEGLAAWVSITWQGGTAGHIGGGASSHRSAYGPGEKPEQYRGLGSRRLRRPLPNAGTNRWCL